MFEKRNLLILICQNLSAHSPSGLVRVCACACACVEVCLLAGSPDRQPRLQSRRQFCVVNGAVWYLLCSLNLVDLSKVSLSVRFHILVTD